MTHTGFDHPSHRQSEWLQIQAERAERKGQRGAVLALFKAAAELEREAARASNEQKDEQAILWRSAVACAYAAPSPSLVESIATEAFITIPGTSHEAAEIREMLDEAMASQVLVKTLSSPLKTRKERVLREAA